MENTKTLITQRHNIIQHLIVTLVNTFKTHELPLYNAKLHASLRMKNIY